MSFLWFKLIFIFFLFCLMVTFFVWLCWCVVKCWILYYCQFINLMIILLSIVKNTISSLLLNFYPKLFKRKANDCFSFAIYIYTYITNRRWIKCNSIHNKKISWMPTTIEHSYAINYEELEFTSYMHCSVIGYVNY